MASFAAIVIREPCSSPAYLCGDLQEDCEEDDQEQEALEALFSLAGGVPDFAAAGDQVPAPRIKREEPSR